MDDKGLNGIVKQEIEEKEVVITKQQETEERNVGSETHLLVDTPAAAQPTPDLEEMVGEEDSVNCEPATVQATAADRGEDEEKEEVTNAPDNSSADYSSSLTMDQDEPVTEQHSRPVSHEEMTFHCRHF